MLMDDWKRRLIDLADRKWDGATAADIALIANAVITELGGLELRIEALESALADLLDSAVPTTLEEQIKYVDCAKHAELLLRGGEPEGPRKSAQNRETGLDADLDFR